MHVLTINEQGLDSVFLSFLVRGKWAPAQTTGNPSFFQPLIPVSRSVTSVYPIFCSSLAAAWDLLPCDAPRERERERESKVSDKVAAGARSRSKGGSQPLEGGTHAVAVDEDGGGHVLWQVLGRREGRKGNQDGAGNVLRVEGTLTPERPSSERKIFVEGGESARVSVNWGHRGVFKEEEKGGPSRRGRRDGHESWGRPS